ncbi:MAG: hypothetical protein WC979_07800 [Candidatus Pacearchaeota archaeon]|jgi:hypothetical protein
MGLQQIKAHQRIIFLNRFVKEILINLSEKERIEEKIELGRLKQKLTPEDSKDIFRQMIKSVSTEDKRKPIVYRKTVPLKPAVMSKPIQPIQRQMAPRQTTPEPVARPLPQNLLSKNSGSGESGMKKIDPLLKDISILAIECPGPEKNILLKRNNETNRAKLTLNQNEINMIIENFSKQARIPIVGGILKAAVGNMVISAVISDFVGSRFIINKITPYSLIAQE